MSYYANMLGLAYNRGIPPDHHLMIYLGFLVSAVVTGGLCALAAHAMAGIGHMGVLMAIGVIGGGLQMIGTIAWYLSHTRALNSDDAS